METKEANLLIPPGIDAISVCLPALPPAIILAFDGHGILIGLAYIGDPVVKASPRGIPPAIARPAPVALPPLPDITPKTGTVGDTTYEIAP